MTLLTAKVFGALLWFGPREFFRELNGKWLTDLQEFLHTVLPKIVVILIGAWLLTRVLKLVTRRMVLIAEHRARRNVAQVRTLASVTLATGIGVVGFLAALQILPLFGFRLEPLLASAGVAGVALGLAAQTVVKDCLNGILFLFEDQFNVGDAVKLAGLSGTVEAMSLRKTQVRDGDGTLYIIPNSQITTVANVTRDFSVATINVSVDFSADPDEVMALLKDVAMSVCKDPAYKSVFLEDPTLLGVDSIKGSQVIYPVQLKTKANQQWAAMRETQRRIRIALAEHHMLPGDPLRVYSTNGASSNSASLHPEAEPALTAVDPTSAKPNQVNPFTGEGM
ncbi:MAG: mechanosensitive ion channel family protein [Silvibacterium sp.]|nr:mechanosensitive ion channel family protein [Silvibacterium sp.]MBV8438795.1 mechanosensitive ion channel family protein [Silvibacterium sp.]